MHTHTGKIRRRVRGINPTFDWHLHGQSFGEVSMVKMFHRSHKGILEIERKRYEKDISSFRLKPMYQIIRVHVAEEGDLQERSGGTWGDKRDDGVETEILTTDFHISVTGF